MSLRCGKFQRQDRVAMLFFCKKLAEQSTNLAVDFQIPTEIDMEITVCRKSTEKSTELRVNCSRQGKTAGIGVHRFFR